MGETALEVVKRLYPFMFPEKKQQYVTESYVASPPALRITDAGNNVWTLGMEFGQGPRGEYAFPILCNGVPTGDWGSRIEMNNGRIRIFTDSGYRNWNGRAFI